MTAQDHLSPDQFPQHIAALKAAHLEQRETGKPNSMGRIHPERPETMYHGTAAALNYGDMIRPGHDSNFVEKEKADNTGTHVFATGDLTEGYHFGKNAAHVEEQNSGGYYGAIPSAHVYEVHPTGRMRPDPEQDPEEIEEGSATSYVSRQPLRVGHEVSRGARDEFMDNFGEDWKPKE